jgi:peptide methionine sulfoxide reductase msrA/msrB
MIPGVRETQAGYANGATANPSYEDVCGGAGHAETVLVDYDPQAVALEWLLDRFYDAIDPVAQGGQGGDVGDQYRTGVYYEDPAQGEAIARSLAALAGRLGRPVAVEALPLQNFYPAEEYHQHYLVKNPAGYCHIGPDQFLRLRAALGLPQEG